MQEDADGVLLHAQRVIVVAAVTRDPALACFVHFLHRGYFILRPRGSYIRPLLPLNTSHMRSIC